MKHVLQRLSLTLLLGLSILSVQAVNIKYVTQTGAGLKDGSSWINAYDSTGLQTAINTLATSGGGQVWVAGGNYYPTEDETGNKNPTDPRMKTFSLKKGVAVYGGFKGDETSFPAAGHVTWLSGDIGTKNDRDDNCYNVVYANDVDSTAIINGFSIAYGNANGGNIGRLGNGGGAYMNSGSLIDCFIRENRAATSGGGAFISGTAVIAASSPAKIKPIYRNNALMGYGGGVYCYRGGTVRNMGLTENQSIYGGGVSVEGAGVVKGCTIGAMPNLGMGTTYCNTASYGGGLWVSGKEATVNNNTIIGNTAIYFGTGVMCQDGARLVNCLVDHNLAPFMGASFNAKGGVYLVNSTLVNCIVRDNRATNTTGGVYSTGKSSIIGCLIHNNTDMGVYVDGSGTNIINSTISSNGKVGNPATYVQVQIVSEAPGECNIINSVLGLFNPNESSKIKSIAMPANSSFVVNCVNSATYDGYLGTVKTNIWATINGISTTDAVRTSIVNTDWSITSSSSLLVNAGTADTTDLGLLKTDLADMPRVYHGSIDIGAFEYRNVRYVTQNGGTCTLAAGVCTRTGKSWETAYRADELQTAIDGGFGEVWVATGTYVPTVFYDNNIKMTFSMASNAKVYGGFKGDELNLEDREKTDLDGNGMIESWEFANTSILSGFEQLSGTDIESWYKFTVVYFPSGSSIKGFRLSASQCALLDGFTITGARSFNNGSSSYPAVLLEADIPDQVSNCIITGNTNIIGSGCVSMVKNSILSGCLIKNNISNIGGGIYFKGGGTVDNSTIRNNKAETFFGFYDGKTYLGTGGGAYFNGGGTMINCIVSGNNAPMGGGLYMNGTGKISGCTITGNTSTHYNSFGGGINMVGYGDVSNSFITTNTATNGGGINMTASGLVSNCVVTNNSATNTGGILLGNSYCKVMNSTIANNSGSNITTNNTTLLNDLANSVFIGETNISNKTTVENCAFTNSLQGTNSILLETVEAALFVKPTSFIGIATDASQKVAIDSADWSIQHESPLVNAGTLNGEDKSLTDIVGNDRVQFDKVDIGAYEMSKIPVLTEIPTVSIIQNKVETIDISWTKVASASGYVVFMKQGSNGTATSVDGVDYAANSMFGKSLATVGDGWFAVYSGADSTVQVSNLVPGAWYRVQVSAYRCSAYKTYSATEEGKNLISIFAKQPQTITFTAPASVVGKNEVTLAAYSTSGLPISYTVPTGAKATIVDNRLVVSSLPAKVMVTATQAGDATRFYAADSVTATIVFSKDTSIITFMSLTEKAFGDIDFTLTASSSNGLSIVYESSNDSVASVVNNIVRINRGGTVTITAIQPESPLYTAAKPVSQKLFISAKTQSIQFDTIYPVTTETAFVTPVAKAESGKEITFSVSPDTVAKIVNNKIQVIGAGTAIVTAYQTGDSSYKEVTATRVLLVKKGMQVISFNALSPKSFSDSSFVLEAGSTTTTPIIFTCSDTNVVRIVGSVATIKKAGKVSITAKQNSTQNYDSAVPVVRPLLITKAEQIITFDTLKTRVYSSGLIITPNVSVNSKRKIMLSSSDVPIAKILNDTSIVVLSAGDVTIFANVAGDSCYNAASEESQTLTISRMEQTLSFDAVTKALYGAADINIHAKSSSRLPISISSSNSKVVSISDSLLSIEGVGEATITVSQKGDNFYAPKEMKFSIVVAKAKDSITFAALENKLLGQKDFTLYAETKSGTAVKFYSSNSAVASVLEDVVTINGAGVCQIRAVVKDSRNFIGDTTVQTFTVSALDVLKMPSFATSRDTIIDLNTLRLNRDSIVYSFVSAKHDSVVIDGSKAIVKPKHSSDCWEGTDTLWFKAANQAIIGDSLTFAVKLAYTRHADQLGMVTTDSLTGTYNIIAWEPQHGASTAQWIVCRRSQSLSQWENIDTVLAADSTYSIDRKVNTRQQAYQYALKTVDSYGCESPLSAYHTTMHLKTGVSLQNLPQLWWSAYEGVDVDAYIVYRKNVETQQYDSIGSTFLTSFTDQYPNGSASYRVAIRFVHKIVTSRLKNDSGPFSQSMSNLSEAIILSTSGLSGSAMTLSPNPVADAATLQCSVWGTYQITVSDAAGRTVMSFEAADTDRALIDASAFPQGSYTVTVRSGDEVHTLNLLKAE